jgi:branched-chain amino acid aminotransferase
MTLPRLAFFRGQVVPYAQARLGLLAHGLNYGTGVFAGIRGYWNQEERKLFLFRLPDHVRRFHESARLLRMELPLNEQGTVDGILALLRDEGLREDCYVRALAFYDDEVVGVRLHGLHPTVAAVAVPFGLYIDKAEGAHCTVSSWKRPDDNVLPRGARSRAATSTARWPRATPSWPVSMRPSCSTRLAW